MTQAEVALEGGFIHWPEIVGLHVVRKNLSRVGATVPQGLLTYKGKIKLHGNNGGINISMSSSPFFIFLSSLSFYFSFLRLYRLFLLSPLLSSPHFCSTWRFNSLYPAGSEGCYTVQAQSRNRVLTVNSDLDGFAKWTDANKDAFIHVRKSLKVCHHPLSPPPFLSSALFSFSPSLFPLCIRIRGRLSKTRTILVA